jgi:hypothetical protein
MNGPYREPVPAPPDPFAAAWNTLRWRRRSLRALVGVVLFFFVAPAVAVVDLVDGPVALIAMAFPLAVPTILFALAWVPPFVCPCCGRPFFASVLAEMGTRTSCSTCRAAVGTPGSEAPIAPRMRASTTDGPPVSRRMRAVRLALATVAAGIGFEVGRSAAHPSAFVATLSAAAFGTTLAAAAVKSRAFPRAWLVPIAALFFATLVGSSTARARHFVRCPPVARTTPAP